MEEKELKEIAHYFYFLGAADGIIQGFKGKKPDFEKRYLEFKEKEKVNEAYTGKRRDKNIY